MGAAILKQQQNNEAMTDAEYRQFLDTHTLTAKLLAAEDIDVMFSQKMSHPAVFDIKRRVLKLAPLAKSQLHLTLGLIIHEVGHALFTNVTPAEMKKLKGISVIMNVLEDGYQERKVCVKFPGARKHLKTIFDHFFSDEQEAEAAKNLKGKPNAKVFEIINVLNYNCKGIKYGIRKDYPSYVTAGDVKALMESETLNDSTFSKRREVASAISKILRKYLDNNTEMPEDDSHDSGSEGEGGQQSSGGGQQLLEDEEEKKSQGKGGGDDDDDSTQEDSDDESETSKDGGSNKKPGKAGKSEKDKKPGQSSSDGAGSGDDDSNSGAGTDLDELFDQNPDALNDHHRKFEHVMTGEAENGNSIYAMPTYGLLKATSNIVDISKSRSYRGRLEHFKSEDKKLTASEAKWKSDMAEAKKVATRIFTQFNMRRASKNLANSSYKRNGALDPTRLSMYKVYDDIFSNIELVPDATNHAYVAVLDWSGSMDNSVYDLTHRLMELVFFANMAEVELEVVLYTTDAHHSSNDRAAMKYPDMAWNGSRFIHVLNTKKHGELAVNERLHTLWYAARQIKAYSNDYYGYNNSNAMSQLNTNGTNILEGTIYGHGILEAMQAQKKSLFVLTDGADEHRFNKVYNDKVGQVASPGQVNDLIFMGSTVNTLAERTAPSLYGVRNCATRVVCDFYKALGHRTISISWNCADGQSAQNKLKFGGMNTNFTVKRPDNASRDEYYKVENVFVNDLISNIV